MKVIFLDIDGVLNSDEWYEKQKSYIDDIYTVDDEPLNLLLDFLSHNDVKIILSSSWRWNTLMKTIQEFQSYKTNVSALTKYMIGVTRRLPIQTSEDAENITRGAEIKDFIDRCEVQITEYCIIDDDTDMLKEQLSHFVKIDGRVGLKKEDIVKIKAILKI